MKKTRMKQSTYAYLLIAPGMILVMVILLFPLIRGIVSSFFYQVPASMEFGDFAGLSHYTSLTNDKIFPIALKNSIIWTACVVVAQYVCGLWIALLLNIDFKGRGIYRSLILIPWVVPSVAASMTWKWMYSGQYGVINFILKSIGIIQKDIDWIGSVNTAFGSVIAVAIWKGIPFITIVLLAALQSIDTSLYEAARIDGASRRHTFWHITMTGIKDVSITTILLTTIWAFNQFDLVYAMTKGGPSNSTQIIPVYTYMTAFNFFNLNFAAAIGVVGLLIVGVFSVMYILYSAKGE